MSMKPKIINILPHEPDYEFVGERPEVHWDTSDGQWVGIYRNEIPDKLGREVLQYTDDFEYEVWQPDYRADQVYSHRFEDDGLVHRLFPAHDESQYHGLKSRLVIHSPALIEYLAKYSKENEVIINLNGNISALNARLIECAQDLPLLQTFRGTLYLPKTMMYKLRWNILASFTYYQQHLALQKLMPRIDYVTYQNDLYQKELRELYQGPTAKLTSGCDFSFWQPQDQAASRQALDLPTGKTIFMTSSLLIPIKQVDKVIEVFKTLNDTHDFMLIITGHGTEEYEAYLNTLAAPLLARDKVRFLGFVTGERLRHCYNSTDLFLNTSVSEGGPVSAMKAIACGIPVFSTRMGNVAERMQQNGSGILADIRAYDQWKTHFVAVIKGETVKKFDRQEAEEYYDWSKIATQFLKIYRNLYQQYYTTLEPST